jgi:hypothetical protein
MREWIEQFNSNDIPGKIILGMKKLVAIVELGLERAFGFGNGQMF